MSPIKAIYAIDSANDLLLSFEGEESFASNELQTPLPLDHSRRSIQAFSQRTQTTSLPPSPSSPTPAASCQPHQTANSIPGDVLHDTQRTLIVSFDASNSMLQDADLRIFWYAVFEFLRFEVLFSKCDVALCLIVYALIILWATSYYLERRRVYG